MASERITISRASLNELIRSANNVHDGLKAHGEASRGSAGGCHELSLCRRLERALKAAKTERAKANSAKAKESRKAKGARTR